MHRARSNKRILSSLGDFSSIEIRKVIGALPKGAEITNAVRVERPIIKSSSIKNMFRTFPTVKISYKYNAQKFQTVLSLHLSGRRAIWGDNMRKEQMIDALNSMPDGSIICLESLTVDKNDNVISNNDQVNEVEHRTGANYYDAAGIPCKGNIIVIKAE